ncbi:MAG TPA: FtsQ-type POTRA domain-containing protein [Pyrinomonadaceae bacterium]|nr:FtsQ-type POTRA domain-containing protein [Pyrinomonadaceae bacterium]
MISHKVGARSGLGKHRASSGASQRPVRRESGGESLLVRLRAIAGYIPAIFKLVLAIVIGLLVFAGYRAAASASFFQVRNVEVQGAARVSADDIRALVRKEVEKTGVWKADLKEMNARLEKLPWVRSAVVSRVLPDGIRVRITERVPRAVVRTASGRFRWVDDDAVVLGEMLPTDQIPAFFLRGLNEEDPEGAREENKERVAKFLELQHDWDAAGLSERVSEVNLIDVRDIRAQLAGDTSQIEVRLGSEDHVKRLKEALQVIDDERQAGRASQILYILSQGKRVTIGHASNVQRSDDSVTSNVAAQNEKPTDAPPTVERSRSTSGATPSQNARSRKESADQKPAKKKSEQTKR